jgi:hypothetical protein
MAWTVASNGAVAGQVEREREGLEEEERVEDSRGGDVVPRAAATTASEATQWHMGTGQPRRRRPQKSQRQPSTTAITSRSWIFTIVSRNGELTPIPLDTKTLIDARVDYEQRRTGASDRHG